MFCVGGKSGWSASLCDILSMNNHHKPAIRTELVKEDYYCSMSALRTAFIINRVKNISFLQYGSHTTVFVYLSHLQFTVVLTLLLGRFVDFLSLK